MEQQQLNPEQLEQLKHASTVGGAIGGLIALAFLLLIIISLWKIFTKAGEPGWAAIVPIYNAVVLLKISGKPIWWIILLLIPFVNFVISIIVFIGLAEKFGKTAGYGIGLALLGFIFMPMLAFSDAQYIGPKTA